MSDGAQQGIEFRELHGAGDAGVLALLYNDVLTPSFDAAELVPLSSLHAGMVEEPSDTDIAVAVDAAGSVIGGAVGEWDADAGVYLLSYLAVRAADRSLGIGTQLMERVRSWIEARRATVALAEVDDPRAHEVGKHGDPAARLRFYERNGAQLLDLRYTQPEVREGSGRVGGMLLIAFGAQDDDPGDSIGAEVLRRFLANYLAVSEGVPPDELDAAVDSLVPGLGNRDVVRLLPVSRYADV